MVLPASLGIDTVYALIHGVSQASLKITALQLLQYNDHPIQVSINYSSTDFIVNGITFKMIRIMRKTKLINIRYRFNAMSQSRACAGAITYECERHYSRVRVKLLASEIVITNRFICRVIASIYSSSKAKCFSIK